MLAWILVVTLYILGGATMFILTLAYEEANDQELEKYVKGLVSIFWVVLIVWLLVTLYRDHLRGRP